MTWFKVDDSLAFHAKAVAAGNAAMGMWTRGGAWCAQQLTDGHVPAHMVPALGSKGQATALVNAGLWTRVDGGYRFHDWLDYQPTAAEVQADRTARHHAKVRAGRAGGVASGVARRKHAPSRSEADEEAERKQNEAPTRPDPTRGVGSRSEEEVEVELPASPDHFATSQADPDDPADLAAAGRTLRAVLNGWPETDPDEIRQLA